MNIGEGFRNIFEAAWNLMNTVIFPTGVVGNDNPITFMNIFILGLGSIFTIKFVRYCMGGHFNIQADKPSHYKNQYKSYEINNFMHSDDTEQIKDLEKLLLHRTGSQWGDL